MNKRLGMRTLDDPDGGEEAAAPPAHRPIVEAPRYRSQLIINEGFTINFERSQPNRWVRFWQRFFLGWQWRQITQ